MSHNPFENQTEQRDPSLLQSRPQRERGWRKGRTLPIVLLLVGAVIIIGAGIVLAVVLASRGSVASSSTITNKQVGSNCGQGSLPPVYWNTLLQQTAQGLHLSVAQVTAQIKRGKSIQDVASAQGISAQQLQSIEISALHAANNQQVAMKCLSQAGADANVQHYVNEGPQDMNGRFTYWFANL